LPFKVFIFKFSLFMFLYSLFLVSPSILLKHLISAAVSLLISALVHVQFLLHTLICAYSNIQIGIIFPFLKISYFQSMSLTNR
jgi:hypothetical protein